MFVKIYFKLANLKYFYVDLDTYLWQIAYFSFVDYLLENNLRESSCEYFARNYTLLTTNIEKHCHECHNKWILLIKHYH